MFIFPVQLTTSRIGNLTRLIQTLLYVMTIHTYIHTYIHTPSKAFSWNDPLYLSSYVPLGRRNRSEFSPYGPYGHGEAPAFGSRKGLGGVLGRGHEDMEGSTGRVVPTGEQVLAYWFVFQTKGCVEISCRCSSL